MSDDTIRLFGGRGSRDFPPDSDQTNGGAPGIVGRITTATASIGVDKFFMIQPQVLTGGECEGCTGTFTDLPTASIPVYNLGPGSYVQGDKVLARFVRSRYVSGRGGSSCTGTLTVNVKCGGSNISGATVTITQGATSYTGTTNGSGNATFTPGLSGTWDITITLAGFQTYTGTFTFACANLTLNITINGASNTIAGTNNVRGCNGVAMPGATVEIRQSGTLYATTTTNSSGAWSATFAGPSGVYDVTYIKSSFTSFTESTSSIACNGSYTFTLPRNLSAASGYLCYGCHGYETISTSASLTLTVSWAGAQTLAYDSGSNSWRTTYVYTGTVWTNAALTTSATTTATIIFTAEPTGPGAGYIAWCLKASGPNAIMSDAFVAANPTLVEQRSLGNSPTVCNNTSPLNVSYGMAEPNTTFTAGTATLTE